MDERTLRWIRIVISVTVAVAVAVLLSVYIQRDHIISLCNLNSKSKVIDARFFESAERKNRIVASQTDGKAAQANLKAADEYRVFAREKRKTIPVPDHYKGLRGDKASDRAQGCEDAYPPPIPFIS